MGLLDALQSAPNGVLDVQKKSTGTRMANALLVAPDEMKAATPLNYEAVLNLATNIPVAGDVLSGLLALRDAKNGDWGSAGLNALGVLPFVPSIGGVIKEVGAMPKKGILPKGIFPDMVRPGFPQATFGEQNAATVKQMANGDFLGRFMPAWKGEGKPFYAIGDDADELKSFMLSRMGRSEAGTAAAKTVAFNNTPLGMLQKEFGDVFDTARSTQSSSQYFTHRPSGLKIRVSDHDLPLHYEQPDIDLRTGQTPDEWMAAIKGALK